MTEAEKAYIAGIIDGEGCISCYKSYKGDVTNYRPRVTVQMQHGATIDFLCALTGAKKIVQNRPDRNKYIMYEVRWGDQQGRRLLEAILPYLIGKKPQAEEFIKLCYSKLYSKKKGHAVDYMGQYTSYKRLQELKEEARNLST